MSTAIQTSSHPACAAVQTVDAARAPRRRDAEAAAAGHDGGAPRHGQVRHALADALSNALAGMTGSADAPATDNDGAAGGDRTDKKALREFEHALFDALRPARGEDGAPGRQGHGFAWGRSSLGDIAERLQALAQQFAASGATAATAAAAAAAAPAAAAGSEAAPTTPTQTSMSSPQVADAAMPASSSRLLSAFQSLLDRVGGPGSAGAEAAGSLAALLKGMAQALQPAAAAAAPAAGALLDTTA